MARLLMVAHYFPPAAGGGVQRTVAFARHLPDFGWEPTVLCATAEGYWAWDRELAKDLPARVRRVPDGPILRGHRQVRRILPRSLRRPLDRWQVPDDTWGWLPGALRAGLAECRDRGVDAIYATGPPWTNLLVGATLARRTGLPFVADFRDPWTESPLRPPPPRALAPVHRALEGQVVAQAHGVLQSTEAYARTMQSRHPQALIQALPNGFEEEDFFRAWPEPPTAPPLVLGYAGSYYEGHGPEGLFRAVQGLNEGGRPDRLRFVLYGNAGMPGPDEAGLAVVRPGYVPHRQVLDRLAQCHGLFLTLPRRPGVGACVPQKLYVYLRLGRPVLYWGPDGEVAHILRSSGGRHGILTEPQEDVPRLQAWLKDLQDGPPWDAGNDPDWVDRYARRRLTQKLAALLDDAVARRGRSA